MCIPYLCCACFTGYDNQTEANQIAQPRRRLKPQKGLSSYSPQPRSRQQATCNHGASKGRGGNGRGGGGGNWKNWKPKRKTEKARTENSGHVRVHAWVANYKFITRFSMWQLQICAAPLCIPYTAPRPCHASWAATSFATCLRFLGRCAASFPFIVCPFFCGQRGKGGSVTNCACQQRQGGEWGGCKRDNIMWHRALRIEVAMSQCRERANPKTKT